MRCIKGMLAVLVCVVFCGNTVWAQPEASEPPPETASTPDRAQTTRVHTRIFAERHELENKYTLLPHKPNYALLYSYNRKPNADTWVGYDGEPDNEEIIFQLSFKFPLWYSEKPRAHRFSAFIGYTQKAYWQAYNRDNSRPFRESNHEPELLVYYFPDWKLFNGYVMPVVTLGVNHQSNGRSEPLSRSWNRIYLDFVAAKGNFAISVKPWYRMPESDASDDNPDILDYIGRGEITLAYGDDDINASLMLRNNFKSGDDNRGSGQLDLSIPFLGSKKVNIYLQLFHGYGESLVDYNHSSTRFGVGVLNASWL